MKIVRESIKSILKPRTIEDINKETEATIDDFVDNISIEEFNKFVLNEYKDVLKDTRPILHDNNYSYITSEKDLNEMINNFACELGADAAGVIMYRFPKMWEIWRRISWVIFFGKDPEESGYVQIFHDILNSLQEKFAEKFHIEW